MRRLEVLKRFLGLAEALRPIDACKKSTPHLMTKTVDKEQQKGAHIRPNLTLIPRCLLVRGWLSWSQLFGGDK